MSGSKLNVDKLMQPSGPDYNYIYKYNGSNLVEYIMVAWPWNKNANRKTRESDAVWQIAKYSYSGNYVIEIAHAEGDPSYTHQANRYLDYNYDIDA